MKVVKKYVFCSPNSNDNALIALNMMFTHQQWKPQQKIAYIQLSHFPDIHTYFEQTPKQTILDLKYLLEDPDPEWDPDPVFPSPVWNEWQELSTQDIKNILTFLEERYDTIYIDLNLSVGKEIANEVLHRATKIIIPTNIAPSNLAGVESFFSKYKSLSPRCSLILNQCPALSKFFVKQKLKTQDINILGTLPVVRKHLWEQTFEAVPLAFHRNSKWKKELFKLLKKLNA
jgi:cellulose biosynthesis protein BcsQ